MSTSLYYSPSQTYTKVDVSQTWPDISPHPDFAAKAPQISRWWDAECQQEREERRGIRNFACSPIFSRLMFHWYPLSSVKRKLPRLKGQCSTDWFRISWDPPTDKKCLLALSQSLRLSIDKSITHQIYLETEKCRGECMLPTLGTKTYVGERTMYWTPR